MKQEQKEKLEQKAKDYIKPFAHQLHLGADEGLIMDLVGFAQTILDNPGEWGLMSINQHIKEMGHEAMAQDLMREDIEKFKAQNDRYRELLGQLKELHSDHELTCVLIEEVLKKEEQ